ncbi:hypothetical protein CC80DRAFT_540934 [Byssothecium circinans]|uniref:Uncharacterized protein n=1 Tax=Byssothecium circinans TaxID=147558 RepID=A0A6A5TCP2_9PLEO|nr:hypothetical protein CC80DRAFT_540934 [Byssothecium circinans]
MAPSDSATPIAYPPPPQDSVTTTPLESSSPSSPTPLAFKIAATTIAGPWTPTLNADEYKKLLVRTPKVPGDRIKRAFDLDDVALSFLCWHLTQWAQKTGAFQLMQAEKEGSKNLSKIRDSYITQWLADVPCPRLRHAEVPAENRKQAAWHVWWKMQETARCPSKNGNLKMKQECIVKNEEGAGTSDARRGLAVDSRGATSSRIVSSIGSTEMNRAVTEPQREHPTKLKDGGILVKDEITKNTLCTIRIVDTFDPAMDDAEQRRIRRVAKKNDIVPYVVTLAGLQHQLNNSLVDFNLASSKLLNPMYNTLVEDDADLHALVIEMLRMRRRGDVEILLRTAPMRTPKRVRVIGPGSEGQESHDGESPRKKRKS